MIYICLNKIYIMSNKTIQKKLNQSFLELNKLILNPENQQKGNIKYQISITKKLIDKNMKDDEFIAFFYKDFNKQFETIDEFVNIISIANYDIDKEKIYKKIDKLIISQPPDEKVQKKIFKYDNCTEEKTLSKWNIFFKEQNALLANRPDITNKMEYIAKLWSEQKNQIEPTVKIPEPIEPEPVLRPSKSIEKKVKIPEPIEPEPVLRPSKSIEKKVKIPEPIIEPPKPIEKKNNKKQSISSTMKKLVWNMTIGEEIGKSKCVCCKSTYITQMSFHCGHIIAESRGGETIVSNLRPICQNCNSSMGQTNMDDFIKTLK
uniref:HNH endonuclease 5 domain-containing protein n=1 Tax=viral metagenome TaxID=1070528 RepID=A0A6C0DQB0_9ZZZZ